MATNDLNFVRVNFSVRGFAKLANAQNVSPVTPDGPALTYFSNILTTINPQPEKAITFPSLPEFRGLDYVGYIIEKERYDKQKQTWVRLENFRIIGNQANSFSDTRVAYGQVYRYRIKAVAKWTTSRDETISAAAQEAQNVLAGLAQAITGGTQQAAVNALQAPTTQLKGAIDQAKRLTQNLKVTVDANGLPRFIFDYSNKTPATDPKDAISQVTNILAAKPNLTDAELATLKSRLGALGLGTIQSQKSYRSEYLESCPSRRWYYVSATETELPPPPQAIKIVPSTPNKCIFIYWLAPANAQNDSAFYTLYKRQKLGDKWEKLADRLAISTTGYQDTDVNIGEKYIYALSTTDLHGYESFLSTQIEAQLNPSFASDKQERLLRWVSGAGARPDETDTVLKKFYNYNERIIAYKSIRVRPSKTFIENSAKVVLRITSLDTHESKDVLLNLTNKRVNK